MRKQACVKSVVIGGRPSHGPMQAIGGAKGANTYAFQTIQSLQRALYKSGSKEQQAEWDKTALGRIGELPVKRSWGVSVNVRDQIRGCDEGQTPLQFVYEEADCKMWWTKEMVVDVTSIWRKVAGVAWGGKTGCIAGSLGCSKGRRGRDAY
jgi:hypothetical protein